MSTNYHTDIASNATATAATFNSPLGQLDAALNHSLLEYYDGSSVSTTVTTAGTFYFVTGAELSFTPSYTGQTYLIVANIGALLSGTAGYVSTKCVITDGTNIILNDDLIYQRVEVTNAGDHGATSGCRLWSAASGDVNQTRKARIYVTHSVSTAVVTTGNRLVQASTH